MGTRKTSGTAQKIDCTTCGKEYTPACDYRQGRCPHHPAMFDKVTAKNAIKSRFYNLLKFFQNKGK